MPVNPTPNSLNHVNSFRGSRPDPAPVSALAAGAVSEQNKSDQSKNEAIITSQAPTAEQTSADNSGAVRQHPEASFDPDAGTNFDPKSQPTSALREPYQSLSYRLNANPNINYIELDRSDLNQGLSEHLNQFNQLLNDNPGLREKLQQSEVGSQLLSALENAKNGFLNTEDILNIQTFVVASGVDISHPNSSTGIDGDYGPKTHAGLTAAFDKLLNQPDAAFSQLQEGIPQATEYANTRRAAYAESGDAYVHGQSRTTVAPANYDMPTQTGDLGAAISSAARRNASNMGTVGYCMKGVRTSLDSISDSTGIKLRMPNGSNIQSAYMAADVIRDNYSDRFEEVSFNANDPQSMAQLRNLPPGAIVVWGNNPDPSTHSRGGGWKHGHISIALGGGMEASDHVQQQITNRNGKYGSCTVFIPKG